MYALFSHNKQPLFKPYALCCMFWFDRFVQLKNFACNTLLLIVFFLFNTTYNQAQDFTNIRKAKPIAISGSVGLRLGFYHSNIENPYYPNAAFTLTGSPTLSVYGVAMPFSFLFSNQQSATFGQPFNQYGVSPTYKWATAHIGYRNLVYSKYGMAGYQMLGAGLELNPGKWRIAFCNGRLKKMSWLGIDSVSGVNNLNYQRTATAGMLRYGSNKQFVMVHFLAGKDHLGNFPKEVMQSSGVLPAANWVMGLGFKTPLFLKGLSFESESAISYYTYDVTASKNDSIEKSRLPFSGLLTKLYQQNTTTSFYTAIDGKLNYTHKKGFQTYCQYRRIDPNYVSMGAYYTQGDLVNLLYGFAMPLYHQKVRIAASIGHQHDNLNQKRKATSVRWIGSANASYTTTHVGVDISYYNYSSDQQPTITRYADSLRITQTSQTFNCSPRYQWSNTHSFHQIQLTIARNTVLDRGQISFNGTDGRKLISQTVGMYYNGSLTKEHLQYHAGTNYTDLNDQSGYAYKSLGMDIGINQTWLKDRLSASMNGGVYQTYQTNTKSTNHTLTLSGGYKITKKIQSDLMLMYNDAPGISSITNLPIGIREWRADINLVYSF